MGAFSMRRTTGNLVLVLSALTCFGVSTVIPNSTADAQANRQPAKARVSEPKEYDRLDGHGLTRKKVDVVEWENNLEIHVYPKGSLRSLGMKIDRTNKDKPAMVIEYAFHGISYTLIRRATVGIPLKDGFKAFQDPTADDYDKIIISNNTLAGGVRPYALATAPTQLYPDHHPSLAQDDAPAVANDEPAKPYHRKSASETPGVRLHKANEVEQDAHGTVRRRDTQKLETEDGGIRNFAF
jgi:hypothetical protein